MEDEVELFATAFLLQLLYAEENENGNKKDLFLWHPNKPQKWNEPTCLSTPHSRSVGCIVNLSVCGLCIAIFISNAVIKIIRAR